jgi:hypothetical protein
MTKHVEDETAAGTLILSGGLAPSSQGSRITLSQGQLTVHERGDGHVLIDGYAVLQASSMEEAIEKASQLLQLHQVYMENWEGECTVRPIVTHCLP